MRITNSKSLLMVKKITLIVYKCQLSKNGPFRFFETKISDLVSVWGCFFGRGDHVNVINVKK